VSRDSIHSPFRYAGGKYYARSLILNYLPAHTTYCEPFAGGGSIFFAKPKVRHNILNDADSELIDVYKVIRDDPNGLIDFLATTRVPSKENHAYYKTEFIAMTALERVGRWYYLNRISYSGIMKMQNCFWGYGVKYSMVPAHWPRAILSASAKLQDVVITNEDFETVINGAADGSLLFVDPPYFNADQDKFYTKSFSRDCHLKLCDVLQNNAQRLSFLLTYDNCAPIRDMYAWANLEAQEWNYCLSRSDDQTKKTDVKGKRAKGKEIFIHNYKRADDVIRFLD
jgi:DNA adenine methylase